MTLYTFQYNNYYNRIIKGYDTLAEYPNEIYQQANIQNFNPNDGVSAEIVLNTDRPDVDYLIAVDNDGNIDSRWFIMEARRIRMGQFHFTLLRDVVYDFKQTIITSPCFIEKATIPVNNPLIYNSENMGYNEIKTEEVLLKDKLQIPWIIGYIKKDIANQPTITIPEDVSTDGLDVIVPTITDYRLYQYVGKEIAANPHDIKFGLRTYNIGISGANPLIYGIDTNGNLADPPIGEKDGDVFGTRLGSSGSYGFVRLGNDSNTTYELYDEIPAAASSYKDALVGLSSSVPSYLSLGTDGRPTYIEEMNTILIDQNKTVYAEDTQTTYLVNIKAVRTNNYVNETVNPTSGIGTTLIKVANACESLEIANNNQFTTAKSPYSVGATFDIYQVSLSPIAKESTNFTLPVHTMKSCINQPYNIFAIPCGVLEGIGSEGFNIETSAEKAYKTAAAISNALGSNLIDLQLLPYCPLPEKYITYGRGLPTQPSGYALNFNKMEEGKDYTYIEVGGGTRNYQVLLYVDIPDFTVEQMWKPVRDENGFIDGMAPAIYVETPTTPINMKVENETVKYRLVSPNYNGAFEISAAKNKGLFAIKADCSYKPFSPYIRVYPQFDGLYGSNFGDSRGLICGGDFSLPQVSDAWVEYQTQNKNYQVMFDRQIQNLEFNNALNRQEARLSAITGALGAGAQSGAIAGGVGGPIAGAIAGGVGAALSAAGGIADIQLMKQRQAEQLDYTKDQFGYELGNIKARPDNITKISAFDINNKLFPFVEKYEATYEERQALINKIKYNGMTVMTIGTIRQYIESTPSYIKGKIIRLEGLNEDFHIATAIAEEINKGVYI